MFRFLGSSNIIYTNTQRFIADIYIQQGPQPLLSHLKCGQKQYIKSRETNSPLWERDNAPTTVSSLIEAEYYDQNMCNSDRYID